MPCHHVEKIHRLAKRHPEHALVTGPISADCIRSAERRLGLSFPPSYQRFLMTFGSGGLCGRDFCGIYPSEPNSLDGVVGRTLDERDNDHLPDKFRLPDHLIVACTDYYDGSLACIDCSRTDESGENPVVEWYPGESAQGDVLTELAPDFGTFMYETVMPVALAEGMSEE